MKSISVLKTQKQTLIEYLLVKLAQQDWHGIRDCCVDIELIEAQIAMMKEINNEP